jgi:N,N'-diacetyllegionaminate synthase
LKKVLIIAEAGVNHNGSMDNARKLIDAAAEAGADIVKFQTFKTENLVSKSARKAEYQKQNMSGDTDDTQFNMLKKLELTHQHHLELIDYCNKKNITFLSTAFDLDSIDLLHQLNMPLWKIPSGEITNLPYLEKIGALGKEVILSSGMCTMQEIEEAIAVLVKAGTSSENLTVLHCNTEYPTPMQDVNLKAMLHIAEKTGVKIGYSDHTLGIEVPIAAVALGAEVIEKHFTLDKTMDGPDHKASLEPAELKAMINAIRNIEVALGEGIKTPSASEKKNMAIARKSIHLKHNLPAGHILTGNDLVMKRPGDGISPMRLHQVVGRKLAQSLNADTQLNTEHLI